MDRHRQYLVRLSMALADHVDTLAAAAHQPKAHVVAQLVEAGLAALLVDRRGISPRQWAGLLLEARTREQSRQEAEAHM